MGWCECGNEPSGSIELGEFFDWLKTYKLLTKVSAPCSSFLFVIIRILNGEITSEGGQKNQ